MKLGRHVYIIELVFTVTLTIYGCKENFLPAIKEANVNYLVVEGFINTGTDSTIVDLSRTFKLDNRAVIATEKGAVVQVESETGTTYILPETIKGGRYGRPSLTLEPSKKYRLRIRTKDAKEYLSDFVEGKTSPPIDELEFDFKNEFLNVNVNSHDPSGKSVYYSYNYIETAEYRAPLQTFWKVEKGTIVQRTLPEDYIWTCWRTIPSNDIILASTAALDKDEVADKPIVSVPRGSLKLRFGYSVLIRQSVLTKEAFAFFEAMKKNTQQVGSIFDAQPSQLFGNIRSTSNPAEIVVGYVTAGTVTEKRITLKPDEMPLNWFLPPPNIDLDSVCEKSKKGLSEPAIVAQYPVWMPLQRSPLPAFPPYSYSVSNNINCYDCRRQGGTNLKPSYWP